MLKPISITPNANPSEYHSLGKQFDRGDVRRAMSRSELMDFDRCPRKWINGIPEESTDATDWGSLVDCFVLTPEGFDSVYAVTPETYPAEGKKKGDPIEDKPWNWNATHCKEWRKEREAEGKCAVRPNDVSEAWKAVKRIDQDELCSAFLQVCERQVQVLVEWHDPETGIVVPVKCLIDLKADPKSEFGTMLGDFKTTNDATDHAWEKTVFYYGLHVQAALYLDAVNTHGFKYQSFVHLVSESVEPYEPVPTILADEYLTLGRAAYQRALMKYCRCLKSNYWPSYANNEPLNGNLDGWRVTQPSPWMIQ